MLPRLIRIALNSTILGKPAGKRRGPTPDWKCTRIRLAEKADASTIASWVQSAREWSWLGGEDGADYEVRIAEWIEQADLSAILQYSPTGKGGKFHSVAFATIAPFSPREEDHEVEIGRLVVDPAWRKRGFGSTLVRHLCAAVCQYRHETRLGHRPPRIRTNTSNEAALNLVDSLPFDETCAPEWATEADSSAHRWFAYRVRVGSLIFGRRIDQSRQRLQLSSQRLAFLSGLKGPVLSAYIRGHRQPRMKGLQALCGVLGEQQIDRVHIALAALGEEAEAGLCSYQPLGRYPDQKDIDLWVLSDVVAELRFPHYLLESKMALRRKRQRWYFLPRHAIAGQAEQLLKEFRKDRELDENILLSKLRIYNAPDYLCRLRIAIHDPAPGSDVAPSAASIEGEGGCRINLDRQAGKDIVRAVHAMLSSPPGTTARVEGLQGFHLHFPPHMESNA